MIALVPVAHAVAIKNHRVIEHSAVAFLLIPSLSMKYANRATWYLLITANEPCPFTLACGCAKMGCDCRCSDIGGTLSTRIKLQFASRHSSTPTPAGYMIEMFLKCPGVPPGIWRSADYPIGTEPSGCAVQFRECRRYIHRGEVCRTLADSFAMRFADIESRMLWSSSSSLALFCRRRRRTVSNTPAGCFHRKRNCRSARRSYSHRRS